MGLDGIELVMAVEDAFEITITDAEATAIRTVGDMYGLVARKTGAPPVDRCLSARAFHQLRRAIRAVAPAAPERLRPSTPIDDALPAQDRRAAWPRLAKATGFRLPELHTSTTTDGLLLWGTVVGAVAIGVLVGRLTQAAIGLVVGILALSVLGMLACLIARPAARHVVSCQTLGELAHRILYRNFDAISRESGAGYDRELWAALCRVIGESLCVDHRELRPEQSFVDDLNVG